MALAFKKITMACCLASFFYPVILHAEINNNESEIAKPKEVTASTSNLDLSEEDARSKFLIWVGEPSKGLNRLDRALARDPDNIELQIIKADIDFRLGKKVAAYDRVNKLMRRAADNPAVKRLYDLIKLSMSSSVSMGWFFNRPADESLTRYKELKAEYVINPNHRAGLKAMGIDLSTVNVINDQDGSYGGFTGSQYNTILYYRYLDMSGDEAGGEVQTNQKHLAIKADYKKWRPWGFHRLSGMTNQIYWGTVEAIANAYRRDGLLYQSDYYIGYDLQSHWGLGLYRYHSKYQGNMAKSTWYYLGLDYKIPERFTEKYLKKYYVNVRYSVKGELFSELSQIHNDDSSYIPFSTQDREVHTLTAEIPWVSKNEEFRVVPFAGGANNSHGIHGAVFGVNASYRYGNNYEVTANFSHDFVADNNYIGNIFTVSAIARF